MVSNESDKSRLQTALVVGMEKVGVTLQLMRNLSSTLGSIRMERRRLI